MRAREARELPVYFIARPTVGRFNNEKRARMRIAPQLARPLICIVSHRRYDASESCAARFSRSY